jgi:hypothetical protein
MRPKHLVIEEHLATAALLRALMEIDTFDNHEVVHVYTATIGRPSDFFNEGDRRLVPDRSHRRRLQSRFNGAQVHEACRQYLAVGTLPLPLSRYVASSDFRSMSDQVTAY